MPDKNNHNLATEATMMSLWRNWAVAFGAIALLLLLALFVPKLYMPPVAFGEAFVLMALLKTEVLNTRMGCTLIVRRVMTALTWSGITMLAINILCTPWLIGRVIAFEIYNDEIPFICALVVFPITAIVCATSLLSGLDSRYCQECRQKYGYYAGDSIVGTLYYRESRYQITVLLSLSVVFTGIDTWYYFARYINANLNTPDHFFFNYLPIAIYLLSLFFLGGRYVSMVSLYRTIGVPTATRAVSTLVRFMVYSGDNILLRLGNDGKWDTPVESIVGRTDKIGMDEARSLFTKLTGATDFELKYIFSSPGFASSSNILHYAAFIDEDKRDQIAINQECEHWSDVYEIDMNLHIGSLAPILANELFRIHTITMAWKTYDRNGRRLYPIKHYRPTFRLRDLRNWTVDYDDISWLNVARNNEDSSLFPLRRLWHKLTNMLNRKSRSLGG